MGRRVLALVALILYTVLWVAPVVLVWVMGVLPYWLVTGRTAVDRLERLLSIRSVDGLLSKAGML